MTTLTVTIDGRERRFRALRVGHELWLHVDGLTHVVDLRPKRGSSTSKSEAGGDISAPMPGKILKVNCVKGDTVKAKAPLVIMEAMKMEYTLTAAFDGVITAVNVKTGDQVQLNQLLVRLEKK